MCVAIANSSVLAQDTCGSIGNNTEDQLSVRGDERFYLNIANPAPCTGNITSWRVCYYGPNNPNDVHSYWATYAVYRRMGSGEDEHYERVSEMFSAVRAQCDVNVGDILDGVIRGGFNCYTDFIDVGDSPLIVQAGDIIGACVFNPPGGERRQLDIVGGMDGLGESLFEDDLTCTVNEIPLSVQHSDLTRCDNRRLHIYANIGNMQSCLHRMFTNLMYALHLQNSHQLQHQWLLLITKVRIGSSAGWSDATTY